MDNKKNIALVIILAVICVTCISAFAYFKVETGKLKKTYMTEAQADVDGVNADAEYLKGLKK